MILHSRQAAFPLRVSPNGRYLVDANDRPFLYHADTPWRANIGLTPSQMDEFLRIRKEQGYTTLQISVLAPEGRNVADRNGIEPFRDNRLMDLDALNMAYFQNLDAFIYKATAQGFYLSIAASWFGYNGNDYKPFINLSNARSWGEFLGKRYQNYQNIMWIMGGDNNISGRVEEVRKMAQAIKAEAPHQLITYHAWTVDQQPDDSEPWLDVRMIYEYRNINQNGDGGYITAATLASYKKADPKPILMGEAHYEHNEPSVMTANPFEVRRQAYWAYLSGASGHAYGHAVVWQMGTIWNLNPTPYFRSPDAPGADQMKHVADLLVRRSWETLVPDTSGSFLTGGGGVGGEYTPVAFAADASFALIYTPGSRTLGVNLGKFAGPVDVSWFDPTSGAYHLVTGSPHRNQGVVQFTTPGSNADGDNDWVLVFDCAPSVRP